MQKALAASVLVLLAGAIVMSIVGEWSFTNNAIAQIARVDGALFAC